MTKQQLNEKALADHLEFPIDGLVDGTTAAYAALMKEFVLYQLRMKGLYEQVADQFTRSVFVQEYLTMRLEGPRQSGMSTAARILAKFFPWDAILTTHEMPAQELIAGKIMIYDCCEPKWAFPAEGNPHAIIILGTPKIP